MTRGPDVVDAASPTPRMRTAGRAVAAAVLCGWRAARRRVHPVRGAATTAGWVGWVVVRGVWPAVMTSLQSQAWAIRWRDLTDRIVGGARRQATAVLLFGLVLWFLPDAGWVTGLLMLPPLVVLLFAGGRRVYRHTGRGRARGRYAPDLGWATWLDLRESVSAHAARESAAGSVEAARPSLQATVLGAHSGRPSARRIAALPVTECGTWVGDVCIAQPWRTRCYATYRDTVAIVAPTGAGKSDLQCHQVIDAPGALVVTQTKAGTYLRTAALRAAVGPVRLVDPDGVTGHPSTLHWSPVKGCADPGTAMQRAGAMTEAAGELGRDNAWFRQRAALVLRVLLLVADIADLGMDTVYTWAAGGTAGVGEALGVMKEHQARIPAGWVEAMAGVVSSKADKQRDGILGILASAVEFMSDPTTAALCAGAEAVDPFDVADFLRSRGTLYLVATPREHGCAAPFLAALADHVFEEAKRVAGPGRLDPPLQINADEAANTIALPLNRWLTDSAGRGIQIVFSVQSRSQLVERWGEPGARTIWNSSTVKLIAGGVTDEQDLRTISELCGTRLDVDDAGRAQRVPKLSGEDIRRIPRWTWLLIHRSTPITLVRTTSVARRRDVLAARVFRPEPAASPRVITPTVEASAIELAYVPEQWSSEHQEVRR